MLNVGKAFNFMTLCLFAYFVTLHADRLSFVIGYRVRINNIISFIFLLIMLFYLGKASAKMDRLLLLFLLGMLGMTVVSCICSPYRTRCFWYLLQMGYTLLCYFWLPYQFFSVFGKERVFRIYSYSFVVVGIFAFCQGFWLAQKPEVLSYLPLFDRPYAGTFEPSYYALYFTPFMVLQNVLYFANPVKNWPLRLFIIAVNFLFCISLTTSILFAYIAFIATILLFSRYRSQGLKFACYLGLLLIPVSIFYPGKLGDNWIKLSKGRKHHSAWDRWHGIDQNIALFKQRPLVGYGYGGIQPAKIEQGLVLPRFKNNLRELTYKDAESTNVGTEVLASFGILGGLSFAIFFIAISALYLKRQRKVLNRLKYADPIVYSEYQNRYRYRGSILYKSKSKTQQPRQQLMILWEGEALFISLIVMLVTWQINQSLVRNYCWTHIAIVCAYLKTTLPPVPSQTSEESAEPLDAIA
ncbi:MAG: hypothetical protein K0U13_01735 [Chlamydiae bacterium]|nr:hypothetical protein [Chlamydiota bacterium]